MSLESAIPIAVSICMLVMVFIMNVRSVKRDKKAQFDELSRLLRELERRQDRLEWIMDNKRPKGGT